MAQYIVLDGLADGKSSDYSIEATGDIDMVDGSLGGVPVSRDSDAPVSGNSVNGTVWSGADGYRIRGAIKTLDIDRPDNVQVHMGVSQRTSNISTGLVQVDDEWVSVHLSGLPDDELVVLASVKTYDGGDPVGVRMRDVDSSGFELFLEEEDSTGDGMNHTTEDVAIVVATIGGIYDSSGTLIGEAGVFNTDQPDSSTWHTVSLDGSYSNPVTFAQLMTYNGSNPSHTRIRNVGSGSFDIKIEEWDYLNGPHNEEKIGYVVLEEGVHELDGELPIEIGTTTTDHEFQDYSYDGSFECNPVFISHCQTHNGSDEIVTRNRSVGKNNAELRVQEEKNANGDHTDETIGCLVAPQLVLSSSHSIDEFRPSGHGFEFSNWFNQMPDLPDLPANIDNMIEDIDLESMDQSYGLCGGMSLAAKDFFMNNREVPSVDETPQSGPLFDYLWERQLDTFDHAGGWDDFRKFVKFFLPLTNTRVKSVPEFNQVKDALDTDRPVVVGLVYVRAGDGQLWDNHQVLAFDYYESGGTTYINVYDPNHPCANDVVVQVDLKERGWPAQGQKLNAEQWRGTTKQKDVIGMIHMDKSPQNPPQEL